MVKGKSNNETSLNNLKVSYAIHLAKGRPEDEDKGALWDTVNSLYEDLINNWENA